MPLLKINNYNIYYEVHGDNYPLLMIQGLGANLLWWGEGLIKEISRHFKVIVFDNRGTGRSEAPDGDFSLEDLAGDAARLLEALEITRAHILGISMGGMIAQEFALHYADKVEKLVLCASHCGGPEVVSPSSQVLKILAEPREGRPVIDIINDSIPILFSEDFVRRNRPYIDMIIKNIIEMPVPSDIFERQLKAILLFNACGRLAGISMPTLIMHGQKDVLVPPRNGEILAAKIAGARLKLFENSAHALFSQEPALVVGELLRFLNE